MKKSIKYSLPFLLLFFYSLFGFITYGDHRWMLSLTLLITFIISFLIFKHSQPKDSIKNSLLFTLPLPLIFIGMFVISGEYSRGVLYFIFIPVSNYLAYRYFKDRKTIVLIASFLLFAIVGFVIFSNLFNRYRRLSHT